MLVGAAVLCGNDRHYSRFTLGTVSSSPAFAFSRRETVVDVGTTVDTFAIDRLLTSTLALSYYF